MSNSTSPARTTTASSASQMAHTAHARHTGHTPGPTSLRTRVTVVACMLNTNESNGGAAAVEELRRFLAHQLFSKRALAHILLASSLKPRDQTSRKHIETVEVSAAAVEIGPTTHNVHAHWEMRITHLDLQLNVGVMASEIMKYTRAHTSFVAPFCSVKLLNGAKENYALKEAYVPNPATANEEEGSSSGEYVEYFET